MVISFKNHHTSLNYFIIGIIMPPYKEPQIFITDSLASYSVSLIVTDAKLSISTILLYICVHESLVSNAYTTLNMPFPSFILLSS